MRKALITKLGAVIGVVNVALVNADMTRIEREGPERLALAGGGIDHFVPSILSNLQRAQQPPNTVSVILASDPRHSPPFVEDKRALERWLTLTGLALAALFIGLENTIPAKSAHARSPTLPPIPRGRNPMSSTHAWRTGRTPRGQ